ncbi:MAG: hypothetical protein NTW62_01655 [Candidatus Nomurabacteria bacterium]|nr:hypothetical protein [Candidatus Nomurabacteria bacterium]
MLSSNSKQFNNPNQTDVFVDYGPQKDSQGRNREDIVNASKSLNKEVLDSITFKNGEYYIEGKKADDWISKSEALHSGGPVRNVDF